MTEALHYSRATLCVEGVDGFLVTEWAGGFVPAVRHAGDDARFDVLVEFFEAFGEEAAFVEEHVVFAEEDLDVVGDAVGEHVGVGEGRGGEWGGVVAFHVRAGKVGVVEEVGEEFWEDFFRFDRVPLFGGAGFGPVEERVPGADCDDLNVFEVAVGEEALGCRPAGDVFFVSQGSRRLGYFTGVEF